MTHPPTPELDRLLAVFCGVDPDRRRPVPGAPIAASFTVAVAALMIWLATR